MMPDLGKYAFVVLSSWAISLVLLAAVIAQSLWRARRLRIALDRAEKKLRKDND